MTEKSTHIDEINRLGAKCATLLEEKYHDKKKISELATRCAELLAENIVLHRAIKAVHNVADDSSGVADWHLNGDISAWEEVLPEIYDIKTSATDAFLAEVRAQGVEMFSEKFGGGTPLSNMVKEVAADFAAKLRKGGNQ
ncbi:hypothetical protein [Escherichia coli]|uniref:hypothetical protein n=1 Tax=Escherichia coli TaxID=562 RepID=UPI00201CF922|nr:hypothetical protein [Escherichia coli]